VYAACCMRSTYNHGSYYAGTISLRLGGFILLLFFANAVEPYDHTAYINSNLGNSTRMTPNLQLQEPSALSLRFQSVDVRSLSFAYVRYRLIETKFLVWAQHFERMPVLRFIRSAAKSPTDGHGTANSPRECNPGIFCQHLQSMCGRVDRSSSAPNGATTLYAAFSLSTSSVALIRNAGQNSTPGHHAGGCHAENSDTALSSNSFGTSRPSLQERPKLSPAVDVRYRTPGSGIVEKEFRENCDDVATTPAQHVPV
jgi:hypothetical protein